MNFRSICRWCRRARPWNRPGMFCCKEWQRRLPPPRRTARVAPTLHRVPRRRETHKARAGPPDDDGGSSGEDHPGPGLQPPGGPHLQAHPAAAIFPLMAAAELEELAQDVAANGLIHPIVLHEGKVVDGRNRLAACNHAGVEPRFTTWTGEGNLLAWVLSANLKRRHLNVSQKAVIAADALPFFETEARARRLAELRRGGQSPDSAPVRERDQGKASEHAAAATGVSPRYVEMAKSLAQSAPALLEKVRTGELTLKQAAKRAKRAVQLRQVKAYRPPAGKYPVIVIDPPWDYGDNFDSTDHMRGGCPYPTMSIEQIATLEIPADDDCVLWLWTTNTHLPDAYRVLDAWGFTPETVLTWAKNRIGTGRWLRGQTEHCILAVKGRPVVTLSSQGTLLHGDVRAHSRKPNEFFRLVESLCPAEPKLEMFARERRDGWVTTGAELGAAPAPRILAEGVAVNGSSPESGAQ